MTATKDFDQIATIELAVKIGIAEIRFLQLVDPRRSILSVNRIIAAFPGNLQDQIRTQLSTALIGVVAQTLLPKISGGRCAAYEVLVVTPGIANLIRENKTFRINSAIQTGAKHGMQLMDDALFHLWRDQTCTLEDVLAKAHNPDDVAKRVVNYRRGAEEGEDDDDVDVLEDA